MDSENASLQERWYGLYRCEVRDPVDPTGAGRIRIRLPRAIADGEVWAPLLAGQAVSRLPGLGDLVVVGFEGGNLDSPIVLGTGWTGMRPATVELNTRAGHQLLLDDHAGCITVQHSNGCRISIDAAGQVEVTTNTTLDITAARVNLHAALVACDGLVRCDALIANSVIASTYTPGAGNVW